VKPVCRSVCTNTICWLTPDDDVKSCDVVPWSWCIGPACNSNKNQVDGYSRRERFHKMQEGHDSQQEFVMDGFWFGEKKIHVKKKKNQKSRKCRLGWIERITTDSSNYYCCCSCRWQNIGCNNNKKKIDNLFSSLTYLPYQEGIIPTCVRFVVCHKSHVLVW